MNYQFEAERISQHIVKYGVHVQPAILLNQEKTKLQDYCNWMIENLPQVFETLLLGPNQLRVQKSFLLSNGKRADMPTFVLTPQGPLFTLPERLYIDQAHDLDIADKDKIFRRAIDEIRSRFSDRRIIRAGVVHEIVFDTEQIDSLEIVASNLKNDLWRQRAKNMVIRLETPDQGKNINIELRPTYLRRSAPGGNAVPAQNMAFGIIVNVDINNRQVTNDLTRAEVSDILAFASDYVPEELIGFLNNEY